MMHPNHYFLAELPLVLILCLTTIIPVCMVIATIYFCRCFTWSNRTTDIFKNVSKEITGQAPKPTAGPASVDANGQVNLKKKFNVYFQDDRMSKM
jgi:hypothetical protein